MTNEELAIQIQLGHTEHYTELWHNVRRLMHKILNAKLSRIDLPNYIAAEDMEQELYFALCKAVQAYDDRKPYKFTSYLEYQVMNAIRCALPSKPLKEYSYNQTTGEDESTELVEFIPDSTAAERLQDIELTDIQKQTRQAVAELPSKERQAITLYYFKGASYKQIGKIMDTSDNITKNTVCKGLHILRQNKALRAINGELQRHYTKQEYVYKLCSQDWDISEERRKVKNDISQRRLNGEYISYGAEQCILYRAEQKYIREHAENDDLNLFYRCR